MVPQATNSLLYSDSVESCISLYPHAAGKECVEQALSAGKTVRAVVRNADAYKSAFSENNSRLQLVKGDVQDMDSLRSALEGVKGVVFAASGRGYWSAAAVDRQASSADRQASCP